MYGGGNDFIIIDNRSQVVKDASAASLNLCREKFSIGADGLLLLEKSNKADFKMRVINPDGSEVDMCGNGARCIAQYAYINKIAGKNMSFEALAGIIKAEITKIGVKLNLTSPYSLKINFALDINSKKYKIDYINTGVPHVIIEVKDLENTDVYNLGKNIRYHKEFQPEGTNANFITVTGEHSLKIRTYERGVEDETLACGTGAAASALITIAKNKTKSPVAVTTRGETVLNIYADYQNNKFDNVCLEGDAVMAFTGSINAVDRF
jgi:diaminopimelate epimerase